MPVPASILAFAPRLPLVVFDEGGRALIDFSPARHEEPIVYVSQNDLDQLRNLLHDNLAVIVRAEQLSVHDRAWAIHRSLLYETALAFRHTDGRVPRPAASLMSCAMP